MNSAYLATLVVFLVPAGSLVYRLRGGILKDLWPRTFGTQLSRLAWAIPTGELMTLAAGAPWWMAPVFMFMHWWSLVMFGTGQYLADPKDPQLPDELGLARNALASVLGSIWRPEVMAVYCCIGALHGALYWLGFRIVGNSQAGESFVGAVSWAALGVMAFDLVNT
jgi:hypothetical protein